MGTEPTAGMLEYQSTKRVLAGEIVEVVPAGCFVRAGDGTSALRLYPEGMTARYTPKVGDYWIVYGDGYESISPRDVFQAGYDRISGNSGHRFSKALEHVLAGGRAARSGWNGKGMFIFRVPGSTFKVNRPPLLGIYPEGTEIRYHGHIDMKTADGMIVPWLCSQTDMLSSDWDLL